MVKWVHFATFIGVTIVISCEAKSPKRHVIDDSNKDNSEGSCDKNPTCGINEVYDVCPRLCPARRCDVDERIIRCGENPKPGDPKCEPGCRCADNYYRNNDGVCVTKDKCPKCFLKNEVYSCQSSDPQTCETIDEEYEPIARKKHCKRECRCKKGFYRNKIGECISKENCLKCNGPHEYFSCGSACDNVCDTIHLQNQTNCPIINIKCNPMCYCEYGFARDHNNTCVPIDECPPKCNRPNEVFKCEHPCPQTCEAIGVKCLSKYISKRDCKRECRCKKGYYRNKLGDCISEENCLKCTGPHEFFSCGGACDNVCSTLNVQNQTNCPIRNIVCNQMCYCEEGYARDENNICVPIADCLPTCGVNEVYDTCPRICPPRICGVEKRRYKCPRNPKPGDPGCKPGCRCADNYFRNKNGVCVTKKECLKCNGPHEYYSCGSACDNVCATLHLQNKTNCPIINKTCNKKCYCEEGYARDVKNICVPVAECPAKEPSCGNNEEPSDKGCVCKEFYVRADDDTCVPEDPFICGINEVYDICPPVCPPQRCGINIAAISCKPSPNPGDPECNPGCRCADNHVRNKDGLCIPRDKCPPEPICSDNEELSDCANAGCRRWKCSDERDTCKDVPSDSCIKGCVCIDSYVRADNGTCIPQEQCPQPIQCGLNEQYSSCANGGCRRYTCASSSILCVDLIEGGCNPGCICKNSYTRADNGTCIPEDQCPPICGENEVYDICPALCPPKSCDVDDRTIDCAPNPLPGDPDCNPGCRCVDNYYKNDLGVCVTREQCPPLIECGPNEIASRCANGGCRKLSCAIPEIVCAKIPYGLCEEGCICKENYLRADNGTCVSEDECPPICGLNEVYDECPPTCPPQRCDVDNRLIKCRRSPMPGDPECKPGCRCADNYYKNEKGNCVTREECPPLIQCGENEHASSCANGGCRKISCARPQIRCVKLREGGCKEGCLCNDNYLRADNGTCIHEKECPPVCGINEVYDVCPPICPQQRCDVDISLILCKPNPIPGDPECNPGCRCADDYFKNSKGVCVPRDECEPPIDCGLNEEYSTCANGGCRRYNCAMKGILCVDLKEGGCRPGCICKESYTRDNNGSCIPEDQCPQQCGPNEEYGCDNTCTKTCNTIDGICVPPTKSKICKLQCHCKDGYTRNEEGKCVSECDGVTEKTEDGLTAFEQGNIAFTEQFLYTADKNNPGQNMIGSPFSVLFLLAQLALYATGQAKTQLLKLLNLSNDCEIRTSVPKYFKLISETNNASFELAQKIYGNDKFPFSENFKKDSEDVFNAEAQNVNFAKPVEAANIINEWVAKQTHNLINNLVSPDSLSANTRLVLAIAIYFKGDWKYQFKPSNTKLLPFYTGKETNDQVKVKMMNQVGNFNYAEIDGVQVIQLPYTVPDISFIACLPKSNVGVKKFIKKLKKSSFIKRTLTALKSARVDVSIPTLDISTTIDLKQVLSDAGVKAIFDPSTAGLSGILKNPEDIFVTSAIQKAKIRLNETGTEAAAATAITVSATAAIVSVTPPIKFNADHPFIYYILCNKLPVFAAITVRKTSVAVPVNLSIKFNANHPFIYYIVYKKILVFAGTYVGPK